MTQQQVESLTIEIRANAGQVKSEMAMVTRQLKAMKNVLIEIVKDTDSMGKNMAGTFKEVGNISDKMGQEVTNATKSSGSSLLGMGAVAGAVGALVAKGLEVAISAVKKLAQGLKNIIVESTKYAMNAVESETLVARVFGEETEAIKEWSSQLADSLGLNEYELRKNAATLYTIAHSIGATSENAMILAKNFTQLSRDMSAFYNIPIEDAFTKLRSGITGETEPLRKLGIIITQSMVKDAAYRHGIAATGAELSEQQKILGRYMTVMEQTAIAQGAWSDELMNPLTALRVLGNQIKQVAINFGSLLLPILSKIIPYLQAFVYILQQAVGWLQNLFGNLGIQVSKFAANANAGYDAATEGAEKATAGAKALKKELLGLAGFDEMNILKQPDTSGGGGGGAGGGAAGFGDFELPDFAEKFGDLKNMAKEIGDKIIGIFQKIKNKLLEILAPAIALWKEWVTPAIEGLVQKFKDLWATLQESPLGEIFMVLLEVLAVVRVFLIGAFIYAITGIVTILEWMIKRWTKQWDRAIDEIAKVILFFRDFGDNMKEIWDAVTGWFIEKWGIAVDNFKMGIENIREFFVNLGRKFKEIWDAIVILFESVVLRIKLWAFRLVVDMLIKWYEFRDKIAGIWGSVKNGARDAWNGIKSVFGGLASWFKSIFTNAWEGVKKVFSTGGRIFSGIKEGILSAFKSVVNTLIDGINRVVSIPFNGINNIISKLRRISIAGIEPFKNFWGINVPRIPHLATGGVVTSPTLAMLAESGKEAIVPLENNTEWIDKLASKIGGSGEIHLTVKVGEDTVGEKIIEYISDKNMRTNLNTINI